MNLRRVIAVVAIFICGISLGLGLAIFRFWLDGCQWAYAMVYECSDGMYGSPLPDDSVLLRHLGDKVTWTDHLGTLVSLRPPPHMEAYHSVGGLRLASDARRSQAAGDSYITFPCYVYSIERYEQPHDHTIETSPDYKREEKTIRSNKVTLISMPHPEEGTSIYRLEQAIIRSSNDPAKTYLVRMTPPAGLVHPSCSYVPEDDNEKNFYHLLQSFEIDAEKWY